MVAMAAVALGFSSCSEDRDPVYQAPTKFVLNEPVMQNMFIQLSDDSKSVLEFTASQPDYGYSAITNYAMQMSMSPDFAMVYDLETVNKTQTKMAVKQADVALGMLQLQGIDNDEKYQAVYGDGHADKVYFRSVASLDGVESSVITSNVVSYSSLKPYFAVKMPGFIYLVGSPEGWAGPTESNAAHYADWKLTEPESAIGSKVYSGVFEMPAGPMFRFYTALTGWDADSYGSQADDNPVEYELVNGSFAGTLVKGKGSFSFPAFAGGKMTVTVDMSDEKNMTVTVQEGESQVFVPRYIYLVGSISGWNAPGTENEEAYADYRLVDRSESGVYTGSWHVEAGHVNFRFALQLTDAGWDNDTQIGSQADDADVACSFTNGQYSGSYVAGKGNWAFDLEQAGTIEMTVDTNGKTVNYTFTAD